MKLLLDQDVYASTAHFLRSLQHDIVTVAKIEASREEDDVLLSMAHEQDRIFVTRDRDFGGLVFVRDYLGGVVYLRMLPSTLHAVHQELARVLSLYPEEELKQDFVVVEPGRHRFRRIVR
jgi:predicted nuclease of predicted toxin-antitoxin system